MSRENLQNTEQKSFNLSYQNIHGFVAGGTYPNTLKYINTTLQDSQIFILAETWFQAHADYIKEPNFVASTPKPKWNPRHCRYLNGIAIFAKPEIKHKIQIIEIHTYFIKFSCNSLIIAGIYFPPKSMDEDQVAQCLKKIGRVDIIVGDFNAKLQRHARLPREKIIEKFAQKHHIYYQSLREADLENPNRWDHVYTNDRLEQVDAQYIRRTSVLSDHGRIMLKGRFFDLDTNSSMNEGRVQYKMYNLRNPSYVHKFMGKYDSLSEAAHRQLPSGDEPIEVGYEWIDGMNRSIVDNINLTCKKILGIQKKNTHEHIKQDVCIQKLQRSKKNEDTLRVWKRLTKRSSRLKGNISIEEGRTYFQKLYKYENSEEKKEFQIDEQSEELYSKFDYRDLDDGLIFRIDSEKIVRVIKNYKSTKSGGPDRVHVTMLKTLLGSQRFTTDLACLFNRIIFYGYTPKEWNTSNIVCIPKKQNEPMDLNNARGISLTQILRRIFECIFHSAIMKMGGTTFCKTSPNQTGFKKKTNTYPNLMIVNDQKLYGRKYKVFIDLKAAYDRVSIRKLLDILQKRGTPKRIIAIIYHLFHKCQSNVIIDQEISSSFHRESGLFQGSILSPLLFNIYIDNLAQIFDKTIESWESTDSQPKDRTLVHRLTGYTSCSRCEETFFSPRGSRIHMQKPCEYKDTGVIPYYLFFADDIYINGSDPVKIQQLLDALDRWCKEYNMIPGLRKCQWIAPREGSGAQFRLQDQNLERVTTYRYLGMEVTSEGIDMLKFMSECLARIKRKWGQLKSYEQYLGNYQRITLVKSEILSQIEYGVPLMAVWIGVIGQKESEQETYETAKILSRDIDEMLKIAREWAGKCPYRLAEYMTNIGTMPQLRIMREAALNHQLDNLPAENPVKLVYRMKDLVPHEIQDQSVIYRAFESTIYKQFQETQRRGRFQDYLHGLRIGEYNDIKSVIYTKAPAQEGKVDAIYHITSERTKKRAIIWRRRKMAFLMENNPDQKTIRESKCNHCNVIFHEGHINQCPLVQDHPMVSDEGEQRKFKKASEYLGKLYPGKTLNFTIMDWWLNGRKFKNFETIYSIIEDNLSREYVSEVL